MERSAADSERLCGFGKLFVYFVARCNAQRSRSLRVNGSSSMA